MFIAESAGSFHMVRIGPKGRGGTIVPVSDPIDIDLYQFFGGCRMRLTAARRPTEVSKNVQP